MKLTIHTDGAARGNPGPAASSFIIQDEQRQILAKDGKCLGEATNNQAEYQAVLNALEYIQQNYNQNLPVEIEIKADSLLVVKQLSGEYKIKNQILGEIFKKIKILEETIGTVKYTHIPRSENSLADQMANWALDNE